jgi:hypothetical protein
MASKTKKGTPAPTSKKPVVRKDGLPTRADKKKVNKAAKQAAQSDVSAAIADRKELGMAIAAPTIAQIMGKPVEWTDELGEALFALISTGYGMEAIAAIDGMPSLYRQLKWLADVTHPFFEIHSRAKATLVPLYEEKAQQLGMTSNPGQIVTEKQVVTKDGDVVDVVETRTVDNVERSKLAVATLQWSLSFMQPKKHGRNPDPTTGTANEQLKGLFEALKAGPVD